jgi:hypothetical protein
MAPFEPRLDVFGEIPVSCSASAGLSGNITENPSAIPYHAKCSCKVSSGAIVSHGDRCDIFQTDHCDHVLKPLGFSIDQEGCFSKIPQIDLSPAVDVVTRKGHPKSELRSFAPNCEEFPATWFQVSKNILCWHVTGKSHGIDVGIFENDSFPHYVLYSGFFSDLPHILEISSRHC